MQILSNPNSLVEEIAESKSILIIQDIDGVCVPLVKDPLTRKISKSYIESANRLQNEFYVLTNGEHEGRRGVNRLVESALGSKKSQQCQGFYLPGLAAGGIQFQDRFGNISTPGVSDEEIKFLKNLPNLMKKLLKANLEKTFPEHKESENTNLAHKSVLDTELSPTINLNSLFDKTGDSISLKIKLQKHVQVIMEELLLKAKKEGFPESFFLHIAPNLGIQNDKEIIKYANDTNIGTTDIQFMIRGARKEAGLLVLLNKFIFTKTGKFPFGVDFNAKSAPQDINSLLHLCKNNISQDEMPTLIGVGDTVTSVKSESSNSWLRGGSDRGFLTLIQELGSHYRKNNKVLLVDSSKGEVERPSLKDGKLKGITDPEDPLKFSCIFKDGPEDYIKWFHKLSIKRSNILIK